MTQYGSPEDATATSQPTDAEVQDQQNAIRAEVEKAPLLTDYLSMVTLEEEYETANNPVFREKAKQLAETYAKLRRSRGDGNCFFRCFIFAYLEGLCRRADAQELEGARGTVRAWRAKLLEVGFQELVFEDAMEMLLEHMEIKGTSSSTAADLLVKYNDDQVSNYILMFLRMVTSGEIQRRSEFFAPFILGLSDMDLDTFCRCNVEPLGEEADHIHITALTDALNVAIRVVYLDGSAMAALGGVTSDVNHHDFIPESLGDVVPNIVLLYRPGHYDILYSH